MQIVFLAYWDNGHEYDDANTVLVGVYTTKRRAEAACARYASKMTGPWYQKATTFVVPVKMNEDIPPGQVWG